MRLSYRRLKDYLPDGLSPESLLNDLTMLGHEVEQFTDLGVLSGKIVVGQILSVREHPNATKLVLCDVDVGGEAPLHIVCGAKNMKDGDKVPVALVGAELSNGVEINSTKIRGEKSEGMLCAPDELGLGTDHDGIMILPEKYVIGEGLDLLIDVSITPNRGDCLSTIGIARDVAAKYKKKVYPPIVRIGEEIETIESLVKVSVEEKEKCSRYAARLIRGVTVGESPLWLKRALELYGFRPINNVVDVTNYVLMELGHPLHPFDFDKITNNHVIIRMAKDGEEIEMLDEQKYVLTSQDLLIADEIKPLALAGVMGGNSSQVVDMTVNVLLESAHFDPMTIRKTAKRFEIQTEASYRFERGTDREHLVFAMNWATQLIKEIAGGYVAKGFIDIQTPVESKPQVFLSINRINSLLGVEFNSRDIADILVNLGFEISHSDKEKLVVHVPSHRNDIERDIDLFEEVARIYGYENIPSENPSIATCLPIENRITKLEKSALDVLLSHGFSEVINYSFISKRSARNFADGCSSSVEIMNPMTQEQGVLRPTLVPSVLDNMVFNHNRNNYDLRLFEIGKVYIPDATSETSVREDVYVICGISGLWEENWKGRQECNFYHIKGIADMIANELHVGDYSVERSAKLYLHPGKSARFVKDGIVFAELGEVHPNVIERLDLKRNVFLFEMNLSLVIDMALPGDVEFKDLQKFPGANRDLAFVVDKTLPYGIVENSINEIAGEFIESVKLFDCYEGENIPSDKKSLAFAIMFRVPDRTLTDDEVNRVQEKIIQHLTDQHGATLR